MSMLLRKCHTVAAQGSTLLLSDKTLLSMNDVFNVASKKGDTRVVLCPSAVKPLAKSRAVLQSFVQQRLPVYGVNTQFGDNANKMQLEGEEDEYYASILKRQTNLIRGLSCGMGETVSSEVVRGTLLIRARSLVRPTSGVRHEIVNSLCTLLNENCLPLMHRYGSVGASGDLIPLSAIGQTLIGSGNVKYRGVTMSSADAIEKIGLKPLQLEMKEGLAVANGTSFSAATAVLALHRLKTLVPLSLAVGAVCSESMKCFTSSTHSMVHQAKGHPGQIRVAQFVRQRLKGSKLTTADDDLRTYLKNGGKKRHIQDYYSIRCMAQGFGPFVENLDNAETTLVREINGSSDNPLVDCENDNVNHAGNFMTDYIATTCDKLRADVAKASTWMHALLANLLHPRKNYGLPPNLTRDPDCSTGVKSLQLLVASLAVHNRLRSIPVCAVMLPTEGDNQDMVGLGAHSAQDLEDVTENYSRIVACLSLAAAQALEIRGVQNASKTGKKLHEFVRKHSAFVIDDRPLSDEVKRLQKDLSENAGELIEDWSESSKIMSRHKYQVE